MNDQNKPVKVDKLISDLRENPRDTRKASLNVYDLCIAAADRLANDQSHIAALQKEIEKLRNGRWWIPVTERFPKNDERVLAYCKDHMIHEMKWSWGLNEWFDKISGGRYLEEFVTHWMPLPEAPEVE